MDALPKAPVSTSAYHHKTPREVATTLNVVSDGQHIQLALRVTNNTMKSVELRFPNGMTHDFIVQDPKGRTVWRWSEGRLFTQTIQNKTVRASDTLTLRRRVECTECAWDICRCSNAEYRLTPIERRVAFTLP